MVVHLAQRAAPRWRYGLGLLSAVLAAFCGSAVSVHAGQFSVTPVRIFMQARDRAAAITVENEGNTELVMQADVYDWRQNAAGEDVLTLSEDLILAPPVLKLAPKAKQVVRLARLRPLQGDQQKTYRMIVREVPEAQSKQPGVTLQIALAFSLPVFITPPAAKRQLQCTVERNGSALVQALCENTGKAYAQVNGLQLADAAGATLITTAPGQYILPGNKRRFDLRRSDSPIPAGKLRLTVSQDDATSQVFEADVP